MQLCRQRAPAQVCSASSTTLLQGVNRFFDIQGDLSVQLAPWELAKMSRPIDIALFLLKVPIRFRSDIAHGVIVVPENYLSDLASIPRAVWSIFMASDDPRIELGAWVHDLIYGANGYVELEDGRAMMLNRQQADDILAHEAMPDLGATVTQQTSVYWALRTFGRRW